LSRAMSRGGSDGWDSISLSLRSSLAIVVLGALVICAIAPSLVELVLGAPYVESGRILGPFLVILLPRSWGTLLWNALLAQGSLWVGAVSAFIGALVLAGTALAARQHPTLAAVIISMNAGQWAWVAALAVGLRTPTRTLSYGRSLLLPLLSAAVTLGVYAGLLQTELGQVRSAVLTLLLGIALFAWGPVFSKAERQDLVQRFRQRSKGASAGVPDV
ncbi:MAG TPA: hypothetical protein VG963_24115, partial [Polyangiaceae bacterium]|nr:hypothetical protein [Polyangiaceae bacterium]